MSCLYQAVSAGLAAQATAAHRPALASAARPTSLRPLQAFVPAGAIHATEGLACRSVAGSSSAVTVEPTTQSAAPAASGSTAGAKAAEPSAAVPVPDSSEAASVWASFAAAVSGEWEGITASFDKVGDPIPLPEYYVPQAYRDWGVELFDWQSQSSMLADETGLMATNRRMMPTVGCEADAIAFTQEACQMFEAGSSACTAAANGSYSHHAPLDISPPDCFKSTFEQCLVLQPAEQGQQAQRLRVVHNLQRMGADGCWRLSSVDLHQERYDSPYRGKLELSGCGGGMKAFASSDRLAAEALQGTWSANGVRYTAKPGDSGDDSSIQCSSKVVVGESWSAQSLPAPLLLHPLRAWSCCAIEGDDVNVAAGVMLDDAANCMAVATRRLVDGRLVAAELLVLTRA